MKENVLYESVCIDGYVCKEVGFKRKWAEVERVTGKSD